MGLNEAERLKNAGIDARKASVTRIPISQFYVEKKGPTAHPRWGMRDDTLKNYIKANGVPGTFLAREAGIVDDAMRVELIDGARRCFNGLRAEEELRKESPRQAPLTFDRNDPDDLGRLYVDVDLFAGSDVELLLARLAANSDPGKVPDSPRVLAAIVKSLAKLGCEDIDAIQAVMPRGISKKDVQALGRWDNLLPDAAAMFDSGEAPLGLLSAVLDAPRAEQVVVVKRLLSAGVKSAQGATRVLNKDKAKEAADRGEAPARAKRIAPKVGDKIAKDLAPPPARRMEIRQKLSVLGGEQSEAVDSLLQEGFVAGLLFALGKRTGQLPERVRRAIEARTR